MEIDKNPNNLSPIDRQLGITMVKCKKCGFLFHVLPKRKSRFREKENELQEPNDLCFVCILEGEKG